MTACTDLDRLDKTNKGKVMKTLGASIIQIQDYPIFEYKIDLEGLTNDVVFYMSQTGKLDLDNMPDQDDLFEVLCRLHDNYGHYVEHNEDDEYKSDIYTLKGFPSTVSYVVVDNSPIYLDKWEVENILKGLISLNKIKKTGKYFNEFGGLKYE